MIGAGEIQRDVAVILRSRKWLEALPTAEKVSRRAALAALARGPERLEVSILLADDDLVMEFNRDYRGKDEPTNVLAFPGSDDPGAANRPVVLGDVVIAYETAAAEVASDANGMRLLDHLSHLVVHGMLHLLGHDHQSAGDARRMEALETEILAGLGVLDPYAEWLEREEPVT